ncbi:MAG: hypothetical protein COV91_02470 [Candidatus Taylorbacteria bacterium CG11_big_fil_rev_8_21_14_0_20_46_11]|uniref:Uncharacterized protein n=1 Tax=Candidatus Taylorbacteria bacterium CG11_big_fil_rev_8_21_14_0_20_46_11 TaxID=1975025 RepID=A0A2H0KC13_9BACT|nr:MAG: hypothetical protein COV91_02470 [Candidatus Taylorbacteria bacterium CG11_big_fil_rev_8_21_14_0_20_46_11]
MIKILAVLLIAYPVYWVITFAPIFSRTFDPSNIEALIAVCGLTLSMILLSVTGIGLLLKKNWSIVTYWIALVLILLLTVIYRVVTPLLNSYVFLILNVIVAGFLSLQREKK